MPSTLSTPLARTLARALPLFACLLLLACGDGGGEGSSGGGGGGGTGGGESDGAEGEPPGYADGRLPSTVRPTRYTLSLAIDPSNESFSGVAEIDVELEDRRREIWLHAQALVADEVSVHVDGRPTQPGQLEIVDEENGVARIRLERPVGPGAGRIRIVYHAPFDRALEGIYRVEHDGQRYAYSQMEPLAARKAFPCFDEPGFKASFDVTMVVRADHVAVTNSLQLEESPLPGGLKSVRFATTRPLPTYLVAFAVGPFDVVEASPLPSNAQRNRPLPFRAIAPRGRGQELSYAIQHTPAIVTALEDYFGIGYPFDKLDIIAVPDFGAGAMENPGAITFRDSLLLLPEDAPARQRRGFAFVMAHELAHIWFGDLVTMRWWDDLWLNEAFATWMETQTIAHVFPDFHPEIVEAEVAVEAFDSDSLEAARQIRQPIVSAHDIHNAFDGITYSKGASVLAMFERWMTPEVFRRGIQAYLRAHQNGNATAEDLMAALSQSSGRDIRPVFESFLMQPGVPRVAVELQCPDGGPAQLALSQSRYLPRLAGGSRPAASQAAQGGGERRGLWRIPVCARYFSGGQARTACTLLEEPQGTLPLEGGCPTWVMPNAEAGGYYRFSLAAEPLAALRQNISALSVRERIAYADSVEAALAAGELSYADAFAALSPLANDEHRQVASAPMEMLAFARDRLVEDAHRRDVQSRAGRLYRTALRRVSLTPRRGEDDDARLMRATILRFLGLVVEDSSVRRHLSRLGGAYVGFGGDRQIHRDAVPPDLAGIALTVATQEGGEAFVQHLIGLLEGVHDGVARMHILSALGAVRDDALRDRVLALVLDPRLRVSESLRPLGGQMSEPTGHGDRAWAWLRQNYDRIVERLGPGFAGWLPALAGHLCSPERAAEVQAFFGPRVERTQGGPRNLASALEEIRICAGAVEHQQASAREMFQ